MRKAIMTQYRTYRSEAAPDGWANLREYKHKSSAVRACKRLNAKYGPGYCRVRVVDATWEV